MDMIIPGVELRGFENYGDCIMSQLQIPARFNGPPNSGNGGYSCGLVALHIAGAARVRLHSPPPLDTNLAVHVNSDGTVHFLDGETLVASGAPAALDMEVPRAPTLEQARRATRDFICYRRSPVRDLSLSAARVDRRRMASRYSQARQTIGPCWLAPGNLLRICWMNPAMCARK